MPDYAPVIEEFWYSIDWDVEQIWALELPVIEMAIEHLVWHLDVPIWPFDGRKYTITPRQVLADPVTYHEEAARIEAADLAYAIDITRNRRRWMILDGVHRLAREYANGAEYVAVRKVPKTAIRQI